MSADCESTVCDTDTGSCVLSSDILYVTPDGSAINDCSMLSPCHLEEAIAAADEVRSTILMTRGQYTVEDGLTVQKTTPIHIIGNGSTYLNATQILLDVFAGTNVSISGLNFDGADRDPRDPVIECDGSATATTKLSLSNVTENGTLQTFGCDLALDQTSVFAFEQTGGTTSVSRAQFPRGMSIGASPSVTVTMINSTMAGFGMASVPNANIQITFTTVTGLVSVPANQAGVSFQDDIISAGAAANAVVCADPCLMTLTNNLLSAESSALSGGNIVGDPLFVNPMTDFHLTAGSPAIDKADSAGPAVDFDGAPRPFGPKADLGAYEFAQ